MAQADTQDRRSRLTARYGEVRGLTEALAAPLSPEDQTVQSMPDVSPTKWHRGHTSWFFETFLLEPELPGYRPFHPAYGYVFNSYYEAVGARHPRPERGLLSRPGAAEVADYRALRRPGHGRAARRGPRTRDPRPGRAGPPPRAAAPRAPPDGHQARAVLQPAPARLRAARLRRRDRPGAPAKAGWIEHQGGPSRSATPAPGSASTTSSHATPATSGLRRGRPTGDLRGVAGVHRRRRLPPPRAVAVRRLGRGLRAAGGTPPSTGRRPPRGAESGRSSPSVASGRSTSPSRSAT